MITKSLRAVSRMLAVVLAVSASSLAAAPAHAACSTNDIVKMAKGGMSEKDIDRICGESEHRGKMKECKQTALCTDCEFIPFEHRLLRAALYTRRCIDAGYEGFEPGETPLCYRWRRIPEDRPCDTAGK